VFYFVLKDFIFIFKGKGRNCVVSLTVIEMSALDHVRFNQIPLYLAISMKNSRSFFNMDARLKTGL